MAPVLFFIASIGAVAGATGVVMLRNPSTRCSALVVHLLSLAALFLLLRAEFVAAAQVVVYAGAVMVLYVFVVAYVGAGDEPLSTPGPGLNALGPFFAVALFAELSIAILGSGLDALSSEGARYVPGFGSPAAIGKLLLTDFAFSFRGRFLPAGRRRGRRDHRPAARPDEDEEDADGRDLSRRARRRAPGATGTMAEAEAPARDARQAKKAPRPRGRGARRLVSA